MTPPLPHVFTDPADDVVLAAVRALAGGGSMAELRRRCEAVREWPEVFERAEEQGVLAAYCATLMDAGGNTVPEPVLRRAEEELTRLSEGTGGDLPGVASPAATRAERRLSPEEELVALAVHLGREQSPKLFWFLDIAVLLDEYPRLDWERVESLARGQGALRAVADALQRVADLLGIELPEGASLLVRRQAEADAAPGDSTLAGRIGRRLRRSARPLFMPGSSDAEAEAGRKFSRGVAWNTTAKMSTRVIQFLVTIVLARLLVPRDFGLAEMAAIVAMFVGMFAEFGFAHALIQKPEVSTEDVRTAMTLSVLFALVLGSAGVAASPSIAALFHAPSLRWPVAVACGGILIAALSVTPRALLMRRFDFRSIAIADFSGCIAYGATGITLAALNAGVWSLVLASLAMMSFQAVVLAARSRCTFRPLVDMDSARQLVPFGARMFGANMLDYIRGNIDYLVVGSALGAAPLGIYTIAFRIADFPRSRLVTTVTEVSFSAMSSVQKDLARLQHAYLRALSMASLFAFPILVGSTVLAAEFVSVVYGPKWMGAVQPLRILLPMGILLIVAQQGSMVLVAKGDPGRYLRLGAAYALAVAAGALAGVPYGISGVALGVLAAAVLYFFAAAYIIWRVADIRPLLTLRAVGVPLLGSMLMVVALVGFRRAVPLASAPSGLLWLAEAVLVGAGAYAAAVLLGGTLMEGKAARAGSPWASEAERMMEQTG